MVTTATGTSTTETQSNTVVDKSMGAFSLNLQKDVTPSKGLKSGSEPILPGNEVFEEKIASVEERLLVETPLVESLIKTLNKALPFQLPFEINFYKSFLVQKRELLEEELASLKSFESIEDVDKVRVQKTIAGISHIINAITVSEKTLPGNVRKVTPTKIDGIQPPSAIIPTVVNEPVVPNTQPSEMEPVVEVNSHFVVFEKPKTAFKQVSVEPIKVTNLEQVVEENTIPIVENSKDAFNFRDRLGIPEEITIPVQEGRDVSIASLPTEKPVENSLLSKEVVIPKMKLSTTPETLSSPEALSSIKKILSTIKDSLTKTMRVALVPVVLLLPPGSNGALVQSTTLKQETRVEPSEQKFMFNLLSPEEQRNLLTFALNPEDYIQKTVGIDPLVYDGILNKTADGVISPYKIIHDETWSELYILVNGTQKDVRKEASDWVETLKTIAKLANLSKVDLKEVGNQSMEAYTNAVQSSVTSTLKVNGVI